MLYDKAKKVGLLLMFTVHKDAESVSPSVIAGSRNEMERTCDAGGVCHGR